MFRIDFKNPQSKYHMALHISYPDAAHAARAKRSGCRAGGDIMIHGLPTGTRTSGAEHREYRLDGGLHRGHQRRDRGDLAGDSERRADSDQAVDRRPVRTSILLWSTASGVILGLFIDATLIGVTVLASAVVPSLGVRLQQRWLATSTAIVLALIPVTLAVLGFLEGRLKAS